MSKLVCTALYFLFTSRGRGRHAHAPIPGWLFRALGSGRECASSSLWHSPLEHRKAPRRPIIESVNIKVVIYKQNNLPPAKWLCRGWRRRSRNRALRGVPLWSVLRRYSPLHRLGPVQQLFLQSKNLQIHGIKFDLWPHFAINYQCTEFVAQVGPEAWGERKQLKN